MHQITENYIDVALSKLKICKCYGTNYLGNPLPKNCVYGRMTKNVYIYIDNLWQFDTQYKLTRFVVWKMDTRKSPKFSEVVVEKHTEWYNMFFAFIDYNDLFDTKVEPLLCRIGAKPERKQPQTYDGYNYNVPYRHRRTLEWENTFTTETDAIYKPVMYIDNKRVEKIKEKQGEFDKIRKSHVNNYKNKLSK